MKLLYAVPASQLGRWGAIILAACLLSAPTKGLAAYPSHPARLVAPKQVVLRLSDVTHLFGKGFTRTSAGPLPRQNAAAAAALLHSSAYTNLFASGMTVRSSVNAYKTTGIAQKTAEATFASRVALTKHAGAGMFTSSLIRYSGVGEYAELTTNVMKSGQGGKPPALPGSHQVTLTFTRGHYGVSVEVVSSTTISMPAVLAAARLMDSRLHGG